MRKVEEAGSVFKSGRGIVDGAGPDHDEEPVILLGYASDGAEAAAEDGFPCFGGL